MLDKEGLEKELLCYEILCHLPELFLYRINHFIKSRRNYILHMEHLICSHDFFFSNTCCLEAHNALEYCMPPLCVNFLIQATIEKSLRCKMVCGGAGDAFQSLPFLDGDDLNVRQSAVVIPKVNFQVKGLEMQKLRLTTRSQQTEWLILNKKCYVE